MTDSYKTPDWILKMFSGWYDPCPLNDNPEINGLETEWQDKTFVNPPYSNPMPWVEKAILESKKGKMIAMMLKHDSSTKWYAKLQEEGAQFLWFSKRLHFKRKAYNGDDKFFTYIAAFPSMLVVL